MSEKTFMVDSRLRLPDKFHKQVMLAVNEIISGSEIRIYCFDDEYAERFKKAVRKELAQLGKMIDG